MSNEPKVRKCMDCGVEIQNLMEAPSGSMLPRCPECNKKRWAQFQDSETEQFGAGYNWDAMDYDERDDGPDYGGYDYCGNDYDCEPDDNDNREFLKCDSCGHESRYYDFYINDHDLDYLQCPKCKKNNKYMSGPTFTRVVKD